jgi:hypothetical protein
LQGSSVLFATGNLQNAGQGPSIHSQARDDLRDNSFGFRFDLLSGLILNRVLYINGVKVRAAKGASLGARRKAKFCGGDRDCGDA